MLRWGGFLSIFDFDPSAKHKRNYHHKSGIFSYKNRYDELFTATGHYHLVFKMSFAHDMVKAFSKNSNDRVALTMLYKEPDFIPCPDNHRIVRSAAGELIAGDEE